MVDQFCIYFVEAVSVGVDSRLWGIAGQECSINNGLPVVLQFEAIESIDL